MRNRVFVGVLILVLFVVVSCIPQQQGPESSLAGKATQYKKVPVQSEAASCQEADNGRIPCINAPTRLLSAGGNVLERKPDYCMDARRLRERYCDVNPEGKNIISSQDIVCERGCAQARCVCPTKERESTPEIPGESIPVGRESTVEGG